MDRSKTFLIVGLGLLGGKYAQVLSGKGYRVLGIDRDPAAVRYARAHDYIVEGAAENFAPLIEQADYVIFGLYPTALLAWVETYAQFLRPGALVTDVSGVKRGVVAPVQQAMPAGVEFIGSHPMAGRESSGIAHSAEVDFAPANFIITPTAANTPAAVEWCRDLARTLGFARISVLSPGRARPHDRLCQPALPRHRRLPDVRVGQHRAGALHRRLFRDLTRIARINDKMWAELFLWNKDNLIGEIDMFSAALGALREKLAAGDREGLEEMFRLSTRRRQAFDAK